MTFMNGKREPNTVDYREFLQSPWFKNTLTELAQIIPFPFRLFYDRQICFAAGSLNDPVEKKEIMTDDLSLTCVISREDATEHATGLDHFCKLIQTILTERIQLENELNNMSAEIVDKYEELNFLYDLSQSLGTLLKPEKIFNIILEKIELSLNAERSSIMLFDEKSQTLDIAAALGFDIKKIENPRVSIEKSISGYVLQNGEALMVERLQDIPPEIEFKKRDDYESQSFISVPMIVSPMKIDNNKIGVINVTEKRNRDSFSSGDLKLLNSIASMAAIAIYNNQLLKKVLESERLKRELEIAEQIQSGMLPTHFPDFPELEIFGRCSPAKNVGGDYFDFFLSGNGSLEMVMADVSGHNIGAALMMANTRSVLKSLIHASSSVDEILHRANKLLYDDMSRSGLFISVFLLRYDRQRRRLSYTNGGHHPVIWYQAKSNRFVKLDANGLLLGVLPEVDFGEKTVVLQPGDLLIMYTDGVIEASDANGNLFGYNRIEKLIAANSALPVRELVDKIFREVQLFSNSSDQADDITLQIMKVKR